MPLDREAKIIKLKLDIIFKRVFGDAKNHKIIAAFLEDLLEMPRNSIKKIEITNVELPPEALDQKFSRLDLRMHVDNRIVNIEIQVNKEEDFNDRTMFYWSKLFSQALDSGDEYGALPKTICINIINFNAFVCKEYHSQFKPLEVSRHELLSDKLDIHFFELRKIKNASQNKPMEDWLNLINAETEGELMDIETTTQIKEVRDTIVILRSLNADEQVKLEAQYREKRLHDEASALNHARSEGKKEGKAEGLAEGLAEGEAIGVKKGEARNRVQMIANVMHNNANCSLEEALCMTGTTMEAYQESVAFLKSFGEN